MRNLFLNLGLMLLGLEQKSKNSTKVYLYFINENIHIFLGWNIIIIIKIHTDTFASRLDFFLKFNSRVWIKKLLNIDWNENKIFGKKKMSN